MTTKEQRTEIIDILNSTTNEQQLYLLQCMGNKISINIFKGKGLKTYEINEPHFDINLNGLYIDININYNK